MKKQLFDVSELARFMSQKSVFDFVNAAKDDKEKHKRIEDARKQFFAQSGKFSNIGFSAAAFDTSDVGNPEMTDFSIYDNCSTFAEFSTRVKQETAISKIKSLVLNHDVADSVKQWCLKRNAITKRNRERKAEQQKAFANR